MTTIDVELEVEPFRSHGRRVKDRISNPKPRSFGH